MVWFNMEAIPKFDIKPVIKSDIKFDGYMDRAYQVLKIRLMTKS